jgi:hypothetical protein
VAVHERFQAALIDWLLKLIGPGGPHKYLPVRLIEQEASYDLHISSVTIHRYLVNPGELTATNAPFRLVEKVLPGNRPGRTTKCAMWRGNKLDSDEQLEGTA